MIRLGCPNLSPSLGPTSILTVSPFQTITFTSECLPGNMSRRRSTSIMGPPADRDIVMGPPPLPAPVAQKPKDNQEIADKYRKLKRRYFELEEVSILFRRSYYTSSDVATET